MHIWLVFDEIASAPAEQCDLSVETKARRQAAQVAPRRRVAGQRVEPCISEHCRTTDVLASVTLPVANVDDVRHDYNLTPTFRSAALARLALCSVFHARLSPLGCGSMTIDVPSRLPTEKDSYSPKNAQATFSPRSASLWQRRRN